MAREMLYAVTAPLGRYNHVAHRLIAYPGLVMESSHIGVSTVTFFLRGEVDYGKLRSAMDRIDSNVAISMGTG